jgi:hypothetical protein
MTRAEILAWVKESAQRVRVKKSGYAPLTEKQARRFAQLRREVERKSKDEPLSCSKPPECTL